MRFEWKQWGDGSSPDGFGNIIDNEDEVIIAREVPENWGLEICHQLNTAPARDM